MQRIHLHPVIKELCDEKIKAFGFAMVLCRRGTRRRRGRYEPENRHHFKGLMRHILSLQASKGIAIQ